MRKIFELNKKTIGVPVGVHAQQGGSVHLELGEEVHVLPEPDHQGEGIRGPSESDTLEMALSRLRV